MKGVFGKYIDINLSKRTIEEYDVPIDWYTKYLGGRGIASRIILEEMNGDEAPLSPDNILIFATGPLQGSGLSGAGRHSVVSVSPKTNCISDSLAGGYFGFELGRSGYDGIMIRGRSTTPLYISLFDGKCELSEADALWGKNVGETEEALRAKHRNARVACIGPAGENLVRFSCIMHDINRAAGRPGFGAVMGSKNLKAVVVKGSMKKPFDDEKLVNAVRKKLVSDLSANEDIQEFGAYGTTGTVAFLHSEGLLPTKNFQEGVFEDFEKIDGGGAQYQKILVGRATCAGCPVRCKRIVEGEFRGIPIEGRYGGPEYQTIAAFGSNCLNNDIRAISLANQMCNQYGLDTISVGAIVAFAMEASEKGYIKEKIGWGDARAIIELINQITFRDGLGADLAEGICEFRKKIGTDFITDVKGLEIPFHDPRGKKSLAITYATSPRGAHHMEATHEDINDGPWKGLIGDLGIEDRLDRLSWEQKAVFAKKNADLASFSNSAVMCAFIGYDAAFACGYNPYPLIREAIGATTGLQMGIEEMLLVGERNYTLLKLSAARAGYTRKDDGLPKRLKQPLPKGESANNPITDAELNNAIDTYYQLRGYDQYGPTNQKLRQLGMDEFLDYIKRR